jgi:hypothetical protein
MTNHSAFPTITHTAALCVIGGGMPGLAAALAAARHGVKVVLMQDRPVLGGNASSEIRVHICGADRHNHVPNMRETGILEELRLENLSRNPHRSFSIWDTVLYEKVKAEPNITLLLNCTCNSAEIDGSRIVSITGWQMTTQTLHRVQATIFADCSGDAILAPLTGALSRIGREGRNEYGESIAPEHADDCTMGMTCLFQSNEYEGPQPFEPPAWAYRFERCEDLPYGEAGHRWWQMGYWWVELGGDRHSIHDTEACRDELIKIAYGVWDHIKNRCPHRDEAANWAMDWVQFLPGKRESTRYIGDYVLTQLDIESGGRFDDLVAYGGWTMDDHHPAGFWSVRLGAPATIFHHAPSPYGIPYRALYSKNIDNLMFAGRDASCTHSAMSSTRVMGTGMTMGQAAGTAAAIATQYGIDPRGVGAHMHELQQALLADDCYLPWRPQVYSDLVTSARLVASQGDPEPVRDGFTRPIDGNLHRWRCERGDTLAYLFDTPKFISEATLVLDTALEDNISMSYHQKDDQWRRVPDRTPRVFRLEGLMGDNWETLCEVENNYQRLVRLPVQREVGGLRFVLEDTWGSQESNMYAFYFD